MSNENHTVRMTIDGSGAKRGAAAYASAVNQIAGSMQKLRKVINDSAALSGGSSGFKKIAGDLAALNNIRINPNLGKNIDAVGNALRRLRAPDTRSIRAIKDMAQAVSTLRVTSSAARNLSDIALVINTYRGPSAAAVKNTRELMSVFNSFRAGSASVQNLNSIAVAFSSIRAPSSSAARNIQQFVASINQLRPPPNMMGLTNMFNAIGNATNRTNGSVIRFSTSLNSIPWGRAQSGARGLTGSMRGLENAFSASYQLGTQLRMLFGTLTLSHFTTSVYNATLELMRFQNVLAVTIPNAREMGAVLDDVQDIARRFGIDINTVYQEFGKFNTSAQLTGATTEQVMATFENMSGAMRVMGLDAGRQRLVWLALTQMFSKGKVQAEELRRQLGEQIPAAFSLLQEALQEHYDDPTLSLDKLMEDGQVGADAVFLLVNKIGEAFGPQFQTAMERSDTAIGNLANSWSYFLQEVGDEGGVFEAIGDVARALSDLMDGDEFKSLAADIGQGLSSAILRAGQAALWLIDNAREVARLMTAAFGAVMARQVLSLIGPITSLALTFHPIGAALGIINIGLTAAGAATVYFWNEQVKLGSTMTTVGEIATIVFSLTVEWLQAAGQAAVNFGLDLHDAFVNGSDASNQAMVESIEDWKFWTNTIIGFFDVVFSFARGLGEIIGAVIANIVMVGEQIKNLATLDFDRFAAANNAWGAMNNDIAAQIEATFTEAWERGTKKDYVGDAMAGLLVPINAAAKEVEKQILKAREIASSPLAMPEVELPDFNVASIDVSGLNPILNADEETDTVVTKRIDAIRTAIEAYQAELRRLDGALKNGLISQDMYNRSLDVFKGTLEESTDPYQALVRNMQEENRFLTMNTKEQAIARRTREITNDLISQGVDLTRQQIEAIQELVEAQYELQNMRPFEAWVRGIDEFKHATDKVAITAIEGMADALTEFVVTGKTDLKSLAQSVLREFIKTGIMDFLKGNFNEWFKRDEVKVNIANPSVMTPDQLRIATEQGTYTGVRAAMAEIGTGGLRLDERRESGGRYKEREGWAGGGTRGTRANLDAIDAAVSERAAAAVDMASQYIGQHEGRNNASINAFLSRGGVDIDAAQTAWCAAFVNSALEQVGVTGSGSLVANSFQNWGQGVNVNQAMAGDVLVQHRGLRADQTGGHVGFATGQSRMLDGQLQLQMLGGNQSDMVTEKWVNASELMVRRADELTSGLQAANTEIANDYARKMREAGMEVDTSEQTAEMANSLRSDYTTANGTVASDYQMQMMAANQAIAAGVAPGAEAAAGRLAGFNNVVAQTGQQSQLASADLFGVAQALASLLGGGGQTMNTIGALGSIAGMFFDVGGVVGSSGGKKKALSYSSIIGDPDAEPIVAHKGEMITPAHQVRAMQRRGEDAMLVDNAAVSNYERNGHSPAPTYADDEDTAHQSGGRRTNITMNITTPDADSFGRSQSQIKSKMMNKLSYASR